MFTAWTSKMRGVCHREQKLNHPTELQGRKSNSKNNVPLDHRACCHLPYKRSACLGDQMDILCSYKLLLKVTKQRMFQTHLGFSINPFRELKTGLRTWNSHFLEAIKWVWGRLMIKSNGTFPFHLSKTGIVMYSIGNCSELCYLNIYRKVVKRWNPESKSLTRKKSF